MAENNSIIEQVNKEKLDERIELWLQKHINCPSPHYQEQDSSDMEIMEDRRWNPKDFKKNLEQCSICKKNGSPEETLFCIKGHLKTFCFFCFQILDIQADAIAEHNRIMGHFMDDVEKLVYCPFRNCPDSEGCLDSKFYYMGAIRKHVNKVHLPKLDELVNKIQAARIREDENAKDFKSSSSGYGSASTQQDHNKDNSKGGESNRPENIPVMHLKKTEIICEFCYKSFPFRIGLQNHTCHKKCPYMTGKFCGYCKTRFDDFTIQSIIMHLRCCRP